MKLTSVAVDTNNLATLTLTVSFEQQHGNLMYTVPSTFMFISSLFFSFFMLFQEVVGYLTGSSIQLLPREPPLSLEYTTRSWPKTFSTLHGGPPHVYRLSSLLQCPLHLQCLIPPPSTSLLDPSTSLPGLPEQIAHFHWMPLLWVCMSMPSVLLCYWSIGWFSKLQSN